MFKSYFKTAWRSATRNKLFSLLNITGLAIGMAVALLIGLWVNYQVSFDRFLPGHERAYEVKNNFTASNGRVYTQDVLPIPLAQALKDESPGIEHVAVTFSVTYGPMSTVLSVGDKTLAPPEIAVSGDFLKIFRFPVLEGNAADALSEPESVVLTASTARALFGAASALGKTVRVNNYNRKVAAVLKDLPPNSSFRFGFLTSFSDEASSGWVHDAITDWNQPAFKVYASLKPNVSYAQVQPQIGDVFKKYAPAVYSQSRQTVFMQPVSDWHLYSEFENGVASGGLIDYIRVFTILGILVLLIACINFMNLSTARFEKRAKEVGIRKAVGSTKAWLVMQFLTESIMMATAAFVLSLLIVELALPSFNTLAQTSIGIPYTNFWFWLLMAGYILFTGFLAGSRPAFYLSSFQPVKVLKGKMQVGKYAALPRKVLVVLQFSASIAFIIGTVVIYQQIQFTRNRPRGYDSNRLMVTEGVDGVTYPKLKQAVLQSGLVSAMTVSLSSATEVYAYRDLQGWENKRVAGTLRVALNAIGDSDYFKTLGIRFLEGRNFAGDPGKDSLCAIFNQAAIAEMQLKEPLNSIVSSNSNPTLPHRMRIIGVVGDALTNGPFAKAAPMIYVYQPWLFVVTYRLAPGIDEHEALEGLRKIFTKYRPGFPFQYHFVDESFAAKFAVEDLAGKLSGIFASLAILISCLGLYGLAAFVAEQRSKEIGIRKVLGASVRSVFFLVTKDFILLVAISCVIASTLAFYFLRSWLNGYYYHTTMSVYVFLFSGAGAMLIAVATISFQALKAAMLNPVESLHSE